MRSRPLQADGFQVGLIESPASFAARLPRALLSRLEDWFGEDRVSLLLGRLRDPDEIMTPDSMSAMKSCSLSFLHTLLKRMAEQRWDVRRRRLDVDVTGNGVAVYDLVAEGHIFTLIVRTCWNGEEKPGRRMDQTADFLASFVSGRADDALVEREVSAMAIPQWGGRTDHRSYGWTAANRSPRSFEYVVDALERGTQPDLKELSSGYVIRNAGFYGNGRAGAANWLSIPERDHPFSVPYHMDMFLLYMWREIGLDFVEAIAAKRSATAAKLDGRTRHYIGVGNSSGLGMTVALVRWPQWLGTWCLTREIALACAKTETRVASTERMESLCDRLKRAVRYYSDLPGPEHVLTRHETIAADLRHVLETLDSWRDTAADDATWGDFCDGLSDTVGRDALEQLNAFLIDLYPESTDKLASLVPEAMRRSRELVPDMTIGDLKELILRDYRWALEVDRSDPSSAWHFWYHSEEAGEQRRGERHVDPCLEYETFVDVIGPVQLCHRQLVEEKWKDADSVALFTLAHPDLAYIVSRIQFLREEPYGEIRGNLIAKSFLPIKVIRFFLSIFGFQSGIPRSVAWVQGVLLQGAPSPADLREGRPRDWIMPVNPKNEGLS